MSGEMDRVLALTEGLPATPLTTQVICVWFLDQSRAAKAMMDGQSVGGMADKIMWYIIGYHTEQMNTPHSEPLETWARMLKLTEGSFKLHTKK